MTVFYTELAWTRSSPDFDYKTYNRNHTIYYANGAVDIEASAAPEYQGDASLPNPEELFISALSSCFLLTFLAISAKYGFIVDSYKDHATGTLSKTNEGKWAVTEVTLKPEITFHDNKAPDAATLQKMLSSAHDHCFITQSVKTNVKINSSYSDLLKK